MILNLPSSSLKKIDFLMKKCTFGKEWLMGSEMRMSVFFIKKSLFFKVPETLRKCILLYSDRLWGLVSVSEWFSTYLHRLWKKSFFRWKKRVFFVRDGLWVQKWEWTFFFIKKLIFFKNDEGRFKIIQRLKQDPKAVPNTMGNSCWKFQ